MATAGSNQFMQNTRVQWVPTQLVFGTPPIKANKQTNNQSINQSININCTHVKVLQDKTEVWLQSSCSCLSLMHQSIFINQCSIRSINVQFNQWMLSSINNIQFDQSMVKQYSTNQYSVHSNQCLVVCSC